MYWQSCGLVHVQFGLADTTEIMLIGGFSNSRNALRKFRSLHHFYEVVLLPPRVSRLRANLPASTVCHKQLSTVT